jgi:dihydropyrimidinase
MTFRKAGFMVEDGMLYECMREINKYGGIVGVHAENDAICEFLNEKNLREGNTTPEYHYYSRPNIVEAASISKAIMFAENTGSALYIFHLTTSEGVDLVREAKKRGVRVYAETCPHYLTLTHEKYGETNGQNYIMTPPLRTQKDIDALWEGINDGTVSVVSSDHCCYDSSQKEGGKTNYKNVSPGISGTEMLLPITHHFGVNKGKISINKLVEILSYNPANIFGLYPDKGNILIGADADLCIFNPDKAVKISKDTIHMMTDYTVYDDVEVKGYPEVVVSKGKVIVDDGNFHGIKGSGNFIKRKQPILS